MKLPLRLIQKMTTTHIVGDDFLSIVNGLERAGIEVEEVIEHNLNPDIIVVKILSISKHPNADKLQLARVTDGVSEYEIVCGAENVEVGKRAVLAKQGAKLSSGMIIKTAKIRGVESQGMLCSESELEIGDDHQGILLLDDNKHTLGSPLSTGKIIDIKTASNRSDLNGIFGIVQELSAHTEWEFELSLSTDGAEAGVRALSKDLLVAAKHMSPLCAAIYAAKYTLPSGRLNVSRDIKMALVESGIGSIDPVVDLTNYLTLLVGQPMHAFDASKIKGRIGVRHAKKGEEIELLNNKKITLTDNDLVLHDDEGPIDLAGVIGGKDKSVDKDTTEIILTIGNFDPTSIRKSAQYHGIRTEASARYERGLPNALIATAAGEFEKLSEDLGCEKSGAELYGSLDQDNRFIDLDTSKMSRFLGFDVTAKQASSHLEKLGFVCETSEQSVKVQVPWWRLDVSAQQDLFEEVLKLIGLEAIPITIPDAHFQIEPSINIEKWQKIQQIRHVLVGCRLFEVNNYSFISDKDSEYDLKENPVPELLNPLSAEQAHIRESLFPSLLKNLSSNRKYRNSEQGIFEISKVHSSDKGSKSELNERLRLAVMTRSKNQNGFDWTKGVLDAITKDVPNVSVSHPTDSDSRLGQNSQGQIKIADSNVGVLGLVSQKVLADNKLSDGSVGYFEIDLEVVLENIGNIKSRAENVFQSAKRSLTFEIANDVLWQEVSQFAQNLDFDVETFYRGDYMDGGIRYLTFDVEYSDMSKTLSNDEVADLEFKLIEKISSKFKAKLKT